jgi:hypothetical protein
MFAVGAALLIGAASSAAHAETAKSKAIDFTVRSEVSAVAPQGPAKSLKWDARKGRWGLTLNVDQPDARDVQLNDVQAGAYFSLNRSLRVGGAVALGEREALRSTKPENHAGAPRVKLETAFKF